MSQWAHNHPEEMAEIASLPPSQQNEALRGAIGLGFRSWCPACERGFTDPYESKMCPTCGQRAGLFMKPDEDEL